MNSKRTFEKLGLSCRPLPVPPPWTYRRDCERPVLAALSTHTWLCASETDARLLIAGFKLAPDVDGVCTYDKPVRTTATPAPPPLPPRPPRPPSVPPPQPSRPPPSARRSPVPNQHTHVDARATDVSHVGWITVNRRRTKPSESLLGEMTDSSVSTSRNSAAVASPVYNHFDALREANPADETLTSSHHSASAAEQVARTSTHRGKKNHGNKKGSPAQVVGTSACIHTPMSQAAHDAAHDSAPSLPFSGQRKKRRNPSPMVTSPVGTPNPALQTESGDQQHCMEQQHGIVGGDCDMSVSLTSQDQPPDALNHKRTRSPDPPNASGGGVAAPGVNASGGPPTKQQEVDTTVNPG